jgi:L-lactate dehydrogenase complex protein LldF
VKIDLHHQLLTWRGEIGARGLVPADKRWGMYFASFVVKRPWLYRMGGGLARWTLRWMPRWVIYNPLNKWGKARDLPAAPKESFRALYARQKERHR